MKESILPIVMVGLAPFDFPLGNNCKNIALEFSLTRRVLYVNPPLDRNTLIKRRKDPSVAKAFSILRDRQNSIEKIHQNLFVLTPPVILESINWIPISFIHSFINKINNKRYAKAIAAAKKELSFKNFILFNDNDIIRSLHLKKWLKPFKYIYYIRDNLTAIGYWKRHGARIEGMHIAQADAVVTNSSYLRDFAYTFNKNSHYVGQGCDFTEFDDNEKIQEPEDLKNLPHPRIGYVGNLTSLRLDIALLIFLASHHPEWSIVLVGPEDEEFKKSGLHKLPNVFFTGPKKTHLLSSYIKFNDVCVNPQLVNELTIGNYPRKIDEYLAMGKPIVATSTKAMEPFTTYVYLADSNKSFENLIEKALIENNDDKANARKSFALSHSWKNSVEEICKVCFI